MKIKKQNTTVEEIEIQLPAYFKNNDDYFKIHEDETVDLLAGGKNNCLMIMDYPNRTKDEIATYTPITEHEWLTALRQYVEKVSEFLLKNGFDESGDPLAEPNFTSGRI